MKPLLAFLVCLTLAIILVPTAEAGPPAPATSDVKWAPPFQGACTLPVICPRGDTPSVINVTVNDAAFVPVTNANVYVQGCPLGRLGPCTWGVPSLPGDGPTNAVGATTVTFSTAASQSAGGDCLGLNVWVQWVPADIMLAAVPYKSYDFTGDGAVDLSDLGFLAGTFNLCAGQAGFNRAFDYNCDNCVNLSDLGFFSTHFNHRCQ